MITIDYIKANQAENQHIEVMKQMHLHFNRLRDTDNFEAMDDFIVGFSNNDICFQYYVCLLSATFRFSDMLRHFDLLRFKAIEVGTKEIGEGDTIRTLHGLI